MTIMASLIAGYEYDIFVSYRQKDNKHDGWVSEFVENLKGEIESTFKEEVSVYFDINQNDGLLETHDVDASLKDKLKCLIFVPIISRTYCDPKSFAWEHEFKAFIDLASKDQFGLKVKLPGGNVANRVLPVQIHDLNTGDREIIEAELGGYLRGIEFIYKEPGVNRPLMPNEDHPDNNLNKTFYRNQINKVSNALKEIIDGLRNPDHPGKQVTETHAKWKPPDRNNLRTKIFSGSMIMLALIVAGYFIIPKLIKPKEQIEKSIAVLPFKLLSDEHEKQYLADGVMDAILLHLQKFKDIRVLSRTSVEQYRETRKTTRLIGQELDVTYLLEGSFQKSGDNVRLIVQLIKTSNQESHAWANEYDRDWKDIFSVQSEVAQKIAGELHTIITPSEKELIKKVPTADLTAYDLFLKANSYQEDYQKTRNLSSHQNAVTFYKAALGIDSTFAKAYIGLANSYYYRYYYPNYFKKGFLDSCLILVNEAISIDDQLDEAYFIKGRYYYENGNFEEALDNFDKALKINPNYYAAYEKKGFILTWIMNDYVKGLESYHKALNLIRGDERPALLRNLFDVYGWLGFIEKAKYYIGEKFKLDKDSLEYFSCLAYPEFESENLENALLLNEKVNKIDSTYIPSVDWLSMAGHDEEAYIAAKRSVEHFKRTEQLDLYGSGRVGYAFWKVGKHKEAVSYFNAQIKYGTESIKLNRDNASTKRAQYDLAGVYAFLGEKTMAYKYLDDFNTMNFYPLWWITYFKHDPLFDSIRNEERFQKILQNIEIKYQSGHEKVRKWLEENNML